MSRDQVLALIGIAVGAFGVGVTILYPESKWIGVLFMIAGAAALMPIAAQMYTSMFGNPVQPGVSEPLAPDVQFDRVADSEVRLAAQVNPDDWVHVWQLWFRNNADNAGPPSTARHLTASVQFFDSTGHVVTAMVGQWAQTQMPEHVGWTSLSSTIDLAPIDAWAKLLFVLQDSLEVESVSASGGVVSQQFVYALAGENLHERPLAGDHEAYMLPAGVNRARVRLTAENMRPREFEFALRLAASGAIESISLIHL